MKKFVVIGLLVLGGLWVCKKTNLCSYASTLWAKGTRAVKGQVPRQFELDRVRNEIEKLDSDVRAMLGPIAEKQAANKRLEREIAIAKANHKTMRENLVTLTREVDAGTQPITFDGGSYTLDEARARLAVEFARFKTLDASLKSREALLAAQKQNVRLAHQQLGKIAEQKRHFEERLAQLAANEEYLNLQQIATPLRFDDCRVADIKNTLDAVEQSQDTEKEKRDLEGQYSTRRNGTPRSEAPAVNTQEIRNFLGLPASAPAAVTTSK
jgi:septation ring formation regulator EzrA